jgi:c-di-GMP-binding flagellar brake protein YcgR
MKKERRLDFRREEENRAVIFRLDQPVNQVMEVLIQSLTRDISVGGAKVVCDKSFTPGDRVMVKVFLGQGKKKIENPAVIKWTKRIPATGLYEMGIEFSDLDPEDELALIDHVYGRKV